MRNARLAVVICRTTIKNRKIFKGKVKIISMKALQDYTRVFDPEKLVT